MRPIYVAYRAGFPLILLIILNSGLRDVDRGNEQCLTQNARDNDPTKDLDVYKLNNKMSL